MKNRSAWTSALALLALPMLLAGCGGDAMMESFTNDAEQARAHEWIGKMRRGEVEAVAARFDPSLADPKLPAIVAQMSKLVPRGEPAERKLVGVNKNFSSGETTLNLTYQYRFGETNLLINCATKEKADGTFTLVGMSVNPIAGSLDELNAFTLSGKTAAHYAVLLAAVAFPLLSLVALFFCVRERNLKRKWLWVLVIIFGVTKFSLDWTTGQWNFTLPSFLLFSGGYMKAPYSSLVLSVAIPAGAIAYFLRRWNSAPAEVSNPA
jgi:hypothetical protein